MSTQKQLAIVIPAYKATFLPAALDSIAAQTSKDFTLYIGDDCSPADIAGIVDKYRDKIDIVYKRFDANLGGKDLVAQWERCIDMTQGEPWLWLFSDDDVMEANCVEEFYKAVKAYPKNGLFHFNVCGLDDSSGTVKPLPQFPKHCSAKSYLEEKIKGHFVSFVVEFVVRRDIFFGCRRFQNFDLAWGSDFISWVKFADKADGIVTCDNAMVLWRRSAENISPNISNPILYRKIKSLIDNAGWLLQFVKSKGYGGYYFFYTKYPLGEIYRAKERLSRKQKRELLNYYAETIKPPIWQKILLKGLVLIL